MRLSAIVPTHNRPVGLRRCLETLQAQDIDSSLFEVVVVDDGSDTDIVNVVTELAAAGRVSMRCEAQPLSGLNVARNRGAAAATGDVLAFLDDDTLVSPGWAASMLRAFSQQACAGAGGRVELSLATAAPPWLGPRRYYLAEYDLGAQPRWLDADPLPVGANCAVRRTAFEGLGGFRPGLDRFAQSLVSNGDTEFFRRLRQSGGSLWYEPDAHVLHCVPAERLTVDYFVARHFAQGISDEALLALEGDLPRWRRRVLLGRDLSRQIGPMAKTVTKDVLKGRGLTNGRFFTNYWLGRWSGTRGTAVNADGNSERS